MMSNPILDSLPDEPVLESNSLATVTPTVVVVRTGRGTSHNVLSIGNISEVRHIKTTYPGLLVISAALLLIALAAYVSKQGGNAAIPLAVFGLAFLLFYFGSRRAVVIFELEGTKVETVPGSLREAAAVLQALRKAGIQ